MNSIICADVLDGLKQIPNNSVHLIVTSPPFNVGINYDYKGVPTHDDRMPHSDYLEWMKEVWATCKNVLVDGGRVCINIDATNNI